MKVKRFLIFSIILCIALIFLLSGNMIFAQDLDPQENSEDIQAETVIEEYPEIGLALNEDYEFEKKIIIKYKNDSPALKKIKSKDDLLSKKQEVLASKDLVSIKLPKDKEIKKELEYYNKRKDIEYAEEIGKLELFFVPNDTYYIGYQYNMRIIDAEQGWEISGGGDPGIVVAIIDTGVAYEDYGIYKKAADLSSSTFVQGYDIANDDSHPNDDHGHGTLVTGTVAQTTNNAYGCAGLAFNTSIMPLRVIDESGVIWGDYVISAIYWAVDNGANVINLSLGGSTYSISEHTAVQYAYNNNVIVVCATGNDNGPMILYPAAYPESIAVGNVDSLKNRYDDPDDGSNYGPEIDVVAPGVSIVQETINGDFDPAHYYDTAFYSGTGTSMSAPHVAALAALILSEDPTLTYDEVESIIKDGCEDLGSYGFDIYYGYGLINVYDSLILLDTPPADPDVEDFVTRFYEECLGRDPDPGGLAYWTDGLLSGQFTAEDLGYGFVMSEEYIAKGTSNEEFVTMLYNLFPDRIPDAEGLAFWVAQLETSATRPGVLNGFIHSVEFSSICESYGITAFTPGLPGFVTRFYTLTLERVPDAQGLDYWVDRLSSGELTGEDIAYGFIFSEEFLAHNHPNGTYVSILYNAFFDRVPDTEGYIYWMSLLESGYSREYIMDSFIHSAEFEDICSSYGIEPY